MKGRAIVVGGSIGGLFAAALLKANGWSVDVYERTEVELAGRGAGIVTHKPLLDALDECGAGTRDLGVISPRRAAYDLEGNVIHSFEFPQLVTSWDRLQHLTRGCVDDAHYHLGHALSRFEDTGGHVRVWFANGHVVEADLLVGADGFRSAVRSQLFPAIQPQYAGYVVWRGVAPEEALPEEIRTGAFGNFGFHLPEGDGEVIGYPIAGAENDLRVGHRRYNWVWYRVVDPDSLADMLTDESGTRHEISIPPPLIRKDVIARLRQDAHEKIARPFATILDHVDAPFFTPIYDHASPAMASGRVALLGDAAFVARPHVGAGVTKAAEDAVALSQALRKASDVGEGLADYGEMRLEANRLAYNRGRHLGEYLVPKYRNDAEKALWERQHNIHTIMRDTAVLNYAAF